MEKKNRPKQTSQTAGKGTPRQQQLPTKNGGDTYKHLLPNVHEPSSSLERELLRRTGPSDERLSLRKKLAELQIRLDETLRGGEIRSA